jgi:restriction endonuclease Mrr
MTQDELIFSLLKNLVGNRVYPDIAKQDTALPYITHQDVGGDAINFMDGAAPGKSNTRLQVNVWAETRAQAKAITHQVETALRAAPALSTTVLGSLMTTVDEATGYRGTIQHFSIWTDT